MSQSKKKRSWKGIMIALTLVLAITVVAGCGSKDGASATSGTVVATYEGGEITDTQFETELANMLLFYPDYEQLINMDDFRQYFVKQQIAYQYLADNATKEAKEEGKKKAEEQLASMKTQVGEDELKKMLDEKKLTEDDLLAYMTRILTVVADYNAKVTDEQLKEQFEKNKDDMTVATVRHILIGFTDKENNERTKEDALKLANELKARLDKGEDFATLAKEYSDDGGSSSNGGLYENVEVGNWVEQFKKAAQTLPLNTISDPVETSYGYHVMKVEARTEKTFETLTDTDKETLRSTIASELMNKFMEEELETKVIKEINLPSVETEQSTDATDGTSTDGTSTDGTSTDGTSTEGTDNTDKADNATDNSTDKPADEEAPAADNK